jgi:hypothetical protein
MTRRDLIQLTAFSVIAILNVVNWDFVSSRYEELAR